MKFHYNYNYVKTSELYCIKFIIIIIMLTSFYISTCPSCTCKKQKFDLHHVISYDTVKGIVTSHPALDDVFTSSRDDMTMMITMMMLMLMVMMMNFVVRFSLLCRSSTFQSSHYY